MTSIRAVFSFVPPETPRAFARRADGFRHAAAGGLWLAPLVYLEHARFGPGWYGKVVSSDPERLLAWAVSKAIPRRALEVKSLPDLDMPRHGRGACPAITSISGVRGWRSPTIRKRWLERASDQ